MIRSKAATKLDSWLTDAKTSLVGSFADGVEKDIDAVRNAIVSQWSNGQTEGQITKLKLIKRHVWTASALQVESSVVSHRLVQSCVRPVCVAHMATGPDVIRRSGPNQMSAVYAASAWNGFSCPGSAGSRHVISTCNLGAVKSICLGFYSVAQGSFPIR